MPSTHCSLHFHLVFSTKDRLPLIAQPWRERLHAFMAGIVGNMQGVPHAIGGTADHVHLSLGISPAVCVAEMLRQVKAVSSRWVHEDIGRNEFAWQEGYGAFSVSASQLPQVNAYVANQEQHHRKLTFQEEYRALLERSGVTFDERYLW